MNESSLIKTARALVADEKGRLVMAMPAHSLYPLRFQPIYQYRTWGGRRLANWLTGPRPDDEPIGEAWLLSDRSDHPSIVAEGPLHGQSFAQLLADFPGEMLGDLTGKYDRFPLLLKLLDARETLSVQVHPSDEQTEYVPDGESRKTEAWVVLESGPQACIYAGLKPATTAEHLRSSLENATVPDQLATFKPSSGDAVLIPAGTVHSLGDVVVFEVQENSDVTFRLYDWDHVDARTGQPRALQVEEAMGCIDFDEGAITPAVPVIETQTRERLIVCEHFGVWRITTDTSFTVGAAGKPRVLVCIGGEGKLIQGEQSYAFRKGDVVLLPAALGSCVCGPRGPVTMLEISLPGDAKAG